jgi:uncharacterized protein YjbI with pentapeptide repeats
LVLESIDRAEAEEVAKLDLTDENQRGVATWIERQHDEFRRAANNLALVGLVTRFHHWLTFLANRIRDDKHKSFDRSIAKELRFLNSKFKNAPVEEAVFEKLVDVRDSIIHANSQASWKFRGTPRQIDPKFSRLDEVNFTGADLREAFQNALLAVGWYEHQVEQWVEAKYGPQVLLGGKPVGH